jgi:putative ABC transport system permease protein
MFYHQSSVDVRFGGRTKELCMISGSDQLTRFIDLHKADQALSLPKPDEVVLSVGVCDNLGIQAGDKVTLRNADLQTMEVTVSAIYDNYVDNFALVHPDTIEKHWGEKPEEQMAFIRLKDDNHVHALGAAVSDLDSVMNVTISQDEAEMIGGMMEALDLVIILIVVCAGLLAVTVLYNLTNININERIREIATIKVLGFNAAETGSYVFKENLTLTVMGILVGLVGGKFLHMVVMSYVRIDMVTFPIQINFPSYFVSAILTMVAALLVDFIMYFQLDKINMAEALKSVE